MTSLSKIEFLAIINGVESRLKEIIRLESDLNRKQISAIGHQISREYGDLSRRVAELEKKIENNMLCKSFWPNCEKCILYEKCGWAKLLEKRKEAVA
jgi:hypothetical protein